MRHSVLTEMTADATIYIVFMSPASRNRLQVQLERTRLGRSGKAAHRLLSIPELLSYIAELFDDPSAASLDESARSTLNSLARSCRAFWAPALDVLWRYQNGLVNIIECMPDDLWEEVEVEDDLYDITYPGMSLHHRRAVGDSNAPFTSDVSERYSFR